MEHAPTTMAPPPPTAAARGDFSAEQKAYLGGFFSGASQRGGLLPFLGTNGAGQFTGDPAAAVPAGAEATVFGTPLDDLCKEERIKREQNGLDVWEKIVANAAADRFPEPPDVFRFKFHGLFHVAPAQDAFMLRCRIPGGALRSYQLAGLAEIAEAWGGGYADITTRANIQVREIRPRDTLDTLIKLGDLGLTSKGSGADNIRNVTATPTSGFDRQELVDVLPLARGWHHYILNHRDLYGLPRKFNVAFDSGGEISACADTNDIGFYAARVGGGHAVEPGVYFRVFLCGITGHQQLASDCGLLLEGAECIPAAAAMVRVFIENGDRTNRKKARLKYLVDRWGVERFLEAVQEKLAFDLRRLPAGACEPRPPVRKHGHLGVHPQRQPGLNYVGVAVPVGRLNPSQMRRLAALAERFGGGEVRLTVWQNMIIPHVADADVPAVQEELVAMGFDWRANAVEGGLVACTGNTGCKFAAANTKGQAVALGRHLAGRVELDRPVNIHLTGCPHSCAQHYVGDIGLQGTPVKVGGETVEGYHLVLGGGVDDERAIGREVFNSVPFDEVPALVEGLLKNYAASCEDDESFAAFSRRHTVDELRSFAASHAHTCD